MTQPTWSRASPLLTDFALPFETGRLTIRALDFGDGPERAASLRETWDELQKWMSWAADRDEMCDPSYQEEKNRRAIADMILRTTIRLVAVEKASGKPVVYLGFHKLDWTARQMELDFWTRKSAHNNGLTTEACRAVIAWAFGTLGATVINVTHTEGNVASKRVIEKCGFTFTHIQRHGAPMPDGTLRDNYKFSLSADDYKDLKTSET